jgi:hypothetical protein
MKPDPWGALCADAAFPYPDNDCEPWDVICTPRKKIKTRKRKVTLARALKQAGQAGIAIRNAMVTPNGVELQLGEAATSDQPNPWDSVQ